jgi:hypothetical protein
MHNVYVLSYKVTHFRGQKGVKKGSKRGVKKGSKRGQKGGSKRVKKGSKRGGTPKCQNVLFRRKRVGYRGGGTRGGGGF